MDTPAQSLDPPPQSSEPEAAGAASGLLSEGSSGLVSEGSSSGVSSRMSGGSGLMRPEQPDLGDRSSQSSFTSQDATGECEQRKNTGIFLVLGTVLPQYNCTSKADVIKTNSTKPFLSV